MLTLRLFALLLLYCITSKAQFLPSFYPHAPTTGGGGTVTFLSTNNQSAICANNVAFPATCTATITIAGGTGHSLTLFVTGCSYAVCSMFNPSWNCTASDGTNIYTPIIGTSSATWSGCTLYVQNPVTGTYTVSIVINCTGTGQCGGDLYYSAAFWAEVNNANATSSLDTNITNFFVNPGTSSVSVTSAGNPAVSGELILSFLTGQNTVTHTGTFIVKSTNGLNLVDALSNPSTGFTVTDSGTQASGFALGMIIGVKP